MYNQWQMDWQALGKRIRKCRLERKYTQEKLAELADVSPSFIGALERADKIPSVFTLVKLGQSLEVSLDYLVFGTMTICDKQGCSLYDELIRVVQEHKRPAQQGTDI